MKSPFPSLELTSHVLACSPWRLPVGTLLTAMRITTRNLQINISYITKSNFKKKIMLEISHNKAYIFKNDDIYICVCVYYK